MRWLCVLAVATVGHAARADDRLAVDVEYEAGVVLVSHGKATGSYAHPFWDDRAYAEVRLGLGTSGSLIILEERAGVGLQFHPSRRVDLRVGWRVGDSYFRGTVGGVPFAEHLLAAELAVQLAVAVTPSWRLRALPLAPAMYWNKTYAAAVGFELGVEHAF